jgi:hypothetical protein
VISHETVWLRSTWHMDGLANFSFSEDNRVFTPLGGACQLKWAYYRGDRVGLYTFSEKGDTGSIEFSTFDYFARQNTPKQHIRE